jgi:uncharacterized membrane protein
MSRVNAVVLRSGVLSVLAISATVAFASGWESPLRTGLVLIFLLFVPGLALVELLEVRDPLFQVALATGVSLALETVAGVTLEYAGAFSAERTMAVVVCLTLAALVVTMVRASRGRA